MNTKRALKLAQVLESLDEEQFDMGTWRQSASCGTVGCIAGWAVELFAKERHVPGGPSVGSLADHALDISALVASALFMPDGAEESYANVVEVPGVHWESVTASMAAQVLRDLVETYGNKGHIGQADVMFAWEWTEAWLEEGDEVPYY